MTRMALRQLGMKVQALRDKRAMTQAALAKKARISRGPPGNGAPRADPNNAAEARQGLRRAGDGAAGVTEMVGGP